LVRNVYGGTITLTETDDKGVAREVTRPTRVLDTIENRTVLEQAILERAQVDGRRAGVDIKEIRLGESAIPPELLLARQREQLAARRLRPGADCPGAATKDGAGAVWTEICAATRSPFWSAVARASRPRSSAG
jgi:hypothetical protein